LPHAEGPLSLLAINRRSVNSAALLLSGLEMDWTLKRGPSGGFQSPGGDSETILRAVINAEAHRVKSGLMSSPRFHLAFPVLRFGIYSRFYVGLLDCQVGRESSSWIDFDFSAIKLRRMCRPRRRAWRSQSVDGDDVPVRHFGVILEMGKRGVR